MKRFLSLVVALMLLSSMFVFEANADSAITLAVDGADYSHNTLPGTIINTISTASLSSGQQVVYFLNGVEQGRAGNAGKYNFGFDAYNETFVDIM